MKLVWLSGWYDAELIDSWEEFVVGWEESPLPWIGYIYFPPSHYSHADARSLIECQALRGGGLYPVQR